jgi:hypothetical protein
MQVSKVTWLVFCCVIVTMTLSVTVLRDPPSTAQCAQQSLRPVKQLSHEESVKRYPIAEFDEPEPVDPARRAALKERKLRNNAHTFSEPSPEDGAIGWFPEKNFDFPALPIEESDLILIGQVLSAKAHRSENKRGIFSEFEVKVEEVLKGRNATEQNVVIVERTGGFLKYPNGRKVLFFVHGHGMPEVGTRNVFFLKTVNSGFQIVTIYELAPEGVLPLDLSNQFQRFKGETEATFIKTLRETIATANPR